MIQFAPEDLPQAQLCEKLLIGRTAIRHEAALADKPLTAERASWPFQEQVTQGEGCL